MTEQKTMTTQELQHFITEFNFAKSPGTFNNMLRDMEKGKMKEAKLTILQQFELGEALKEKEEKNEDA